MCSAVFWGCAIVVFAVFLLIYKYDYFVFENNYSDASPTEIPYKEAIKILLTSVGFLVVLGSIFMVKAII